MVERARARRRPFFDIGTQDSLIERNEVFVAELERFGVEHILVVGLPVALLLAWVYELTPEGRS